MGLLECLKINNMELPNTEEYSIVDAIRVVYIYSGNSLKGDQYTKGLEKYIKNKKHLLFILSDGMGSNLIDSLPYDSILKRNKKLDLKTVSPSTTGCVLSSVATAEYPCVHGMIGWYSYNREKNIAYYPVLYEERYTHKDLEEFGLMESDVYVYPSKMNELRRKTCALFEEGIVDSKFSKYIMKENRIGYKDIGDAFNKVIKLLENEEEDTFTYLYISNIDGQSHKYGIYSEEVKKVIGEIESNLNILKKRGIKDLEVIITADHGQINVENGDIIMDFSKYEKYFYALPGIDCGTATYYIKPGQEKEFVKSFEEDFKGEMFLFKTEEYVENNVFGNEGISEYMKSNMGEYISFCAKGKYLINSRDTSKYFGKMKGCHSGFSKEELVIPLIIL